MSAGIPTKKDSKGAAARDAVDQAAKKISAWLKKKQKFKEPVEVGQYLIVHPGICFGKLTFKGTRVPASTVLAYPAKGETFEEILAIWPELKREAVGEAIRLAGEALRERSEAQARAPRKVGRAKQSPRVRGEAVHTPRSISEKEQPMKLVEVGQFLVVDPRVCHGKLTFKGTRVPVETVLNRLAKGRTVESLLVSWPELTREAIAEAVTLAKEALVERSTVAAEVSDEPIPSGRTA
jgi:uncharacterized protein (DUF433 family)